MNYMLLTQTTGILRPFAIIMGNEGNGVRLEILSKCNEYAHIVMNDNCESLNVAVATSIILYELFPTKSLKVPKQKGSTQPDSLPEGFLAPLAKAVILPLSAVNIVATKS